MFVCRLGARRQVRHLLRGNHCSAAHFHALFGVTDCPDGDTIHYLCQRLTLTEVQEVVTTMTATLIRRKVLYPYRLYGYFVIAFDGTGMLTFPQRHCPHCLTRHSHGKTLYYHDVLEAKIVTPNGFAFSVMSEFIENPAPNVSKQDCELKAFYRLTERLKQRFPHLPICVTLDGLFAGGPTLSRCEAYGWKYIIVLPEGNLPSVHQEFATLLHLAPEQTLHCCTGPHGTIHQEYRWMNDILYEDTEGQEHSLAVLECLESVPMPTGVIQTTRFKWLTNFRLTAKKVMSIAQEGGRIRWKTENEGFNVQKNGGYALEHAYSRDEQAAKVFYLLLQAAHLIAQLMERGSLFRKAFPNGVGSAKNLAFRLLEAWRNVCLSVGEVEALRGGRIQIRFDSS